jgi:hypothetical protein
VAKPDSDSSSPKSFLSRWEKVIKAIPSGVRQPVEDVTTPDQWEVLIMRRPAGGLQQIAVHIEGCVDLESILADAKSILVRDGLLKEEVEVIGA